MESSLVSVGGAIGIFAATNVDDLVVLTVLFLACRAEGQPRVWQIWAGLYVGIAALVAASGAAALGLTIVPDPWVGLLGLVPIALGLFSLVRGAGYREAMASDDTGNRRLPAPVNGLPSVARSPSPTARITCRCTPRCFVHSTRRRAW